MNVRNQNANMMLLERQSLQGGSHEQNRFPTGRAAAVAFAFFVGVVIDISPTVWQGRCHLASRSRDRPSGDS